MATAGLVFSNIHDRNVSQLTNRRWDDGGQRPSGKALSFYREDPRARSVKEKPKRSPVVGSPLGLLDMGVPECYFIFGHIKVSFLNIFWFLLERKRMKTVLTNPYGEERWRFWRICFAVFPIGRKRLFREGVCFTVILSPDGWNFLLRALSRKSWSPGR